MKYLGYNILVPVLLALAANGLIFALGWTHPDLDYQPGWAPPGFVIGVIWTVLFGLMGAARSQTPPRSRRLVSFLILLCLAYPFYTLGLQAGPVGKIGILVTLAFAVPLTLYLKDVSPRAAWLLVPLVWWLCYAFVLVGTIARPDEPLLIAT